MPWHISKSSMMFKTKILICNVFALCNEDLNIKVLGYYVPVCIIPFFFFHCMFSNISMFIVVSTFISSVPEPFKSDPQ